MFDGPYDYLRLVTLLLALFVFIGMIIRFPNWTRLSLQHRFYGLGLAGAVLVTVIGMIETILNDVPGGIRTVGTFIVMTHLSIATLIPTDPNKPHWARRYLTWLLKPFLPRDYSARTQDSSTKEQP